MADYINSHINDETYSFNIPPDERIGIFFPVHGWRPPKLVRQFVSRLHITNAEKHYCYIICTAGDTVGKATNMLKQQLMSCGLRPSLTTSLLMPESYVGLPFMDVDKPENGKRKKQDAVLRLNTFINDIIQRRQYTDDITVGKWPRINSEIIGEIFDRYIISDKPFHVNSHKCIGCGLCAKKCPVEDIICGKGQKPLWKHNGRCLTCFACYHHCPTNAIQYGHRTKGKGQYYYEKSKCHITTNANKK